MIGRQRAVLGGEPGAVQVGELIGMQLDRQPRRPRGATNTRAVCSGENAMVSQNASTASASLPRATAGIISQTWSI
jgi:hypothetical protein